MSLIKTIDPRWYQLLIMTKCLIIKGLLIDPVILLSSLGYISRNSNNVLKKLQKLMILLSLSLTLIGVNIELSILVEK